MDIIEKIKRGFKENTVYTTKDDGESYGAILSILYTRS